MQKYNIKNIERFEALASFLLLEILQPGFRKSLGSAK